jgi:hypothetical protein
MADAGEDAGLLTRQATPAMNTSTAAPAPTPSQTPATAGRGVLAASCDVAN